MNLKRIQDAKNLKGKTVLVRIDCNVPVVKGKIDKAESFRLERVVPTIRLLVKRGAKIILLGHRGRPDGRVVESLRLESVAKRMKKYVNSPNVSMLENLRFDQREEKNDLTFAKELASLGDIYVNDAFAVSHRKHASLHAITRFLPSYAGLLMQEEVRVLSDVLEKPRRPFVVVLGGAKISTKIGLIRKFLRRADAVLLGGALASTVLHTRGYEVGRSLIELSEVKELRGIVNSKKLFVPDDVVVKSGRRTRVVAVDAIQKGDSISDIGPETVKRYAKIICGARLVVANGPLGIAEEPRFRKGTTAVLRAIATSRAYSIVGGGETIQALHWSKLGKKMSFVSTGGGAMLEFLEAGTLPGLEPLINK